MDLTFIYFMLVLKIPVIASGGLASIQDVKAMLEPRAQNLEGAIAGRALYDGRIDPAQALADFFDRLDRLRGPA